MNPRGGTTIIRICFGGRNSTYRVLGVSRTSESGKVRSSKVIRAEVKKVRDLKLVATFDPRDAGLPPGKYAWRIAHHSGQCPKSGPMMKPVSDCLSYFPAKRRALYDLRPVIAVGCTGGNGQFVTHGPRGRKRVALTFDDGPSTYTPEILRILRRKKAKATFFMLGQQVASYPSYARRVLALGHEVANHSYDHDLLPEQFEHPPRHPDHQAGHRIQALPVPAALWCREQFTPPGGPGRRHEDRQLGCRHQRLEAARRGIDRFDDRPPGPGPGSIVLMHDGGGPRGGTVDALWPPRSGACGAGATSWSRSANFSATG